jgi:hypothetical protein
MASVDRARGGPLDDGAGSTLPDAPLVAGPLAGAGCAAARVASRIVNWKWLASAYEGLEARSERRRSCESRDPRACFSTSLVQQRVDNVFRDLILSLRFERSHHR